jgi:hypothetical protein
MGTLYSQGCGGARAHLAVTVKQDCFYTRGAEIDTDKHETKYPLVIGGLC